MRRLFDNDAELLAEIMRGCLVSRPSPDHDLWIFEARTLWTGPLLKLDALFEQILGEFPGSYLFCDYTSLKEPFEPTSEKHTWLLTEGVTAKQLYNILYIGDWLLYKSDRVLADPNFMLFTSASANAETMPLFDSIVRHNNISLWVDADADCDTLMIGSFPSNE